MPLNIRIQWNAGTACVSECVLKTLACRGLRVGPSKVHPWCVVVDCIIFLPLPTLKSVDGLSEYDNSQWKTHWEHSERRLLVNPYGPETQIELCYFLGENDLNSEKGGTLPTSMFPILLPLKNILSVRIFGFPWQWHESPDQKLQWQRFFLRAKETWGWGVVGTLTTRSQSKMGWRSPLNEGGGLSKTRSFKNAFELQLLNYGGEPSCWENTGYYFSGILGYFVSTFQPRGPREASRCREAKKKGRETISAAQLPRNYPHRGGNLERE